MRKKIEIEGDGSQLPPLASQDREVRFREFKNTKKILERYNLTHGCKGCEASAMGGDSEDP